MSLSEVPLVAIWGTELAPTALEHLEICSHFGTLRCFLMQSNQSKDKLAMFA